MRHALNFGNYQRQPGFGWTAPVAEHANFHNFVMDPPRHLSADDFDPWTDDEELPSFEEVRDGR